MSILRRKGASWIIAYIVSVKKYKGKTNNILLITLVSIKGSEIKTDPFLIQIIAIKIATKRR